MKIARLARLLSIAALAPLSLIISLWLAYSLTLETNPFILESISTAYILWILVFLGLSIYFAFRRDLRRFRNRIVVAATCMAFVVPAAEMDDYAHLLLLLPYYAFVISCNQTDADVRFDWGVTGEDGFWDMDTADQRTLIYDRSGNTARHVGEIGSSEGGRRYTKHLAGRFYIDNEIAILH